MVNELPTRDEEIRCARVGFSIAGCSEQEQETRQQFAVLEQRHQLKALI